MPREETRKLSVSIITVVLMFLPTLTSIPPHPSAPTFTTKFVAPKRRSFIIDQNIATLTENGVIFIIIGYSVMVLITG
jgi:hypothetical protein